MCLQCEAYFDESGTHEKSRVCVVAGVIGTSLDWRELESNWQRILEAEQIHAFHATDCANGAGEFKGWEKNRRAAFYDLVIQQLLDRQLCAVAVLVPTDGYKNAFADSPGKPVFPQPFLIGFRHVIDEACEFVESVGEEATVTLTFEMAKRQQGRARELANFLITYAKAWEHYDRVSCIRWDIKTSRGLQVADIFAYEIYREMTRPPQHPPRAPFLRLRPLIRNIKSWSIQDLEMLAAMSEIVDKGLPLEPDAEIE